MLEETIHANRLEILGKLTATLVHEIRNSLSALKLNLDFLELMRNELPVQANESVGDSIAALSRIEYLVENLLSFSRRETFNKEYYSLNDITSDTLELIKLHAIKKQIRVDRELCPEIPPLYLDRNKIIQVFMNLLTNAVDSCRNDGRIVVKTYLNQSDGRNEIIWEVEDNGRGIKESDQDKIFSDFYTNKKGGTGLGLSVCRKLLDEHNAGLDFQSTYGVGTRFFIRFNQEKMVKEDEAANINN